MQPPLSLSLSLCLSPIPSHWWPADGCPAPRNVSAVEGKSKYSHISQNVVVLCLGKLWDIFAGRHDRALQSSQNRGLSWKNPATNGIPIYKGRYTTLIIHILMYSPLLQDTCTESNMFICSPPTRLF